MPGKLSDALMRISSGRVALAALLIFVLFGASVLPREAERAREVSGGAGSPDTKLFYSAQDLYDLAELYGPEGRRGYIEARFTFDLVFPLIYGFFLVTSLSWFLGRISKPHGWLRSANLVPVMGVIFDFCENITTSLVMHRYPASSFILAHIAPILSAIKWIFVYGSFLILALAIFAWLFRRVQKGNDPVY